MSEIIGFLFSVWATLVAVQREISAELAQVLRIYAATGEWRTLATFLPWSIVFGAAHALTPGHSKTLLATFVAGSGAPLSRGLLTAVTLSATHIATSVAIVLLALPVVSMTVGEVGRAPVLDALSRGLLGAVGFWLIIAAIGKANRHSQQEGICFGVFAGLIPCPLTLFVMTFASARGVTEAGIAFAFMMLIGVAFVLALTAALATALRAGLGHALPSAGNVAARVSRVALFLTGVILLFVASVQFTQAV